MRHVSLPAAIGLAMCLPLACHLVSGVGDLQFSDTVSASGGSGAWVMGGHGGGTAGTGGAGGTGTGTSPQGGGGAGAMGGSGGSGGQGGELPPGPPCSDFYDAFDTEGALDDTLWTVTTENAPMGVTGGYFYVQPAGQTSDSRSTIRSLDVYDIRSCTVTVQVPLATNDDGDARTSITVASEEGYSDSFGFRITGGSLVSRVTAGGNSTEQSVAYDAGQHQWLRFREDAGTVHFESSADGSAWAEVHQTPTPSFSPRAFISLGAGASDTTSITPGEARFDNVNLPP